MDDTSLAMEMLDGDLESLKASLTYAEVGGLDKIWNADPKIFGDNGKRMIEELDEVLRDFHTLIAERYLNK